ncbi:MAG: 3'(2'),5'-bisphosphate nucleotidase CysQ [Gammaproteobacteria bacterium]
MLENAQLLNELSRIASAAGREIMAVYARTGDVVFSEKADASPLTEADTRANTLICRELQMLTPLIPILSEEGELPAFTQRQQWSEYWLIDPLDGTKEFISKNGEFTVNIALIRAGVPAMGVVHAPVTGTTWLGVIGLGAWKQLEGGALENIRTRALASDSTQSTLAVLASRRHGEQALEALLEDLRKSFKHVELGNMGSSLKFCALAEGKADLYPRLAPTSEWDTAAAQAVLEAAGGRVMKTDLTPLLYNSKADILNPSFFAVGDPRIDWETLLHSVHH